MQPQGSIILAKIFEILALIFVGLLCISPYLMAISQTMSNKRNERIKSSQYYKDYLQRKSERINKPNDYQI